MTEITKTTPADPRSVELVFDEAKRAAVSYIDRAQQVQQQAEYIIATVYTNIKMDHGIGRADILKWMDEEIQKLNALKTGPVKT